MMYVSLMLFPVVTLLLMTAAERAFGGTSPVWLIVATLTVSAAVGRFVLSRVAVAQLRQFYPDYIRRELS